MNLGIQFLLLIFGLLLALYLLGLGASWSILLILSKIPIWGWILILAIIFIMMMSGDKK